MSNKSKTIKISCKGASTLPLDLILEFQGNLKKLSKENLGRLKKNILINGFVAPIFVFDDNGDYKIIDGHGRIQALISFRQEGYVIPMIPVDFIDAENEKEARKILLSITGQYGEFDLDELQSWINDLDDDIAETLRLVDQEIDLQINIDEEIETDGDDEIPEEVESVTKLGDLWELGNHRVLCGDSTDYDTVAYLMDGKKADMVFTDPPYNIDYGNIKRYKFKERDIKNDNMSSDEFKEFCTKFTESITQVTDDLIYVFGPPGPDGRIMFMVLDSILHCSTTVVWNKDQFTLGRGKYQNKYEPCWFGWNKSGKNFTADRKLTNVWDFSRPKKSEEHPTMKPIGLCEIPLRHGSNTGGIVSDLFLGSGSTLIAAEKTNRICYGMELDEHYCDVIVKRYIDWMTKNNREIKIKLNGETVDHKKLFII